MVILWNVGCVDLNLMKQKFQMGDVQTVENTVQTQCIVLIVDMPIL